MSPNLVNELEARPAPVDDSDGTAEAHVHPRRSWERWGPARRPSLRQLLGTDLTALGLATAVVANQPVFAVLAPMVMIVALRIGDVYATTTNPSALDQLSAVARSIALGALVLAAGTAVGPRLALTYVAVATLAVISARAILFALNRRAAIRRPRRALILGTGQAGQELASRLYEHPEYGLVPVGFVTNEPQPLDPTLPIGVVAATGDLLDALHSLKAERLIIDSESVGEPELLHVLDQATRLGVEVAVLPVLGQHLSTAITVESLAGTTLLSYRPSRHRGVTWGLKRALDGALAALGLLALAPVFGALAIAIKLESRGPVFFRQERVGRHGRPFRMLKFRSMVVDAEKRVIDLRVNNVADGPYFKDPNDPRITRVGRFLRRFSIDELPQLVNVLRGEMSLVGPRPALAHEVAEYPEWFTRRLLVPPGITGLWQVAGRYLLSFGEATRLDVYYVDHWSLGIDLKILVRTLPVILTGRGAR